MGGRLRDGVFNNIIYCSVSNVLGSASAVRLLTARVFYVKNTDLLKYLNVLKKNQLNNSSYRGAQTKFLHKYVK